MPDAAWDEAIAGKNSSWYFGANAGSSVTKRIASKKSFILWPGVSVTCL